MGDVQFNGTQEEWDALVEKNKKTQVSKKQTEISDEEILNAAKESRLEDLITSVGSFELGARWYREQIKNIDKKL